MLEHVFGLTRKLGALVTAVGVGLGAVAGPGAETQAATDDVLSSESRLEVAGRASATPHLASHGETVVVVWSASHRGISDLYAARSDDGGRSFDAPVQVNDQEDDVDVGGEMPPQVVFAPPGPDADPTSHLAVAWRSNRGGHNAIRAARSSDGGRSFSSAITLHDPTLAGVRGWHSLAAASDGTVHVVWLDGRHADGPTREPRNAPRQDALHAAWRPDGTMTETALASDVCFCCKTATAVDDGGTVFAAWRHIYPGNIRDMALSRSRDGGSFEPAVRVSEDEWELEGCPDDGPSIVPDGSRRIHAV